MAFERGNVYYYISNDDYEYAIGEGIDMGDFFQVDGDWYILQSKFDTEEEPMDNLGIILSVFDYTFSSIDTGQP